ncbi:MAG: hypothetical protein JW765_07985 [Deltaproteobacteria bacterium]|nr:hypothetical protein [Candidatus Zymogenaceae bacterium]
MTRREPIALDLSRIRTYSLMDRTSKVTVADFARPPAVGLTIGEFIEGLGKILAAGDLRTVIGAVVRAVEAGRPVMAAMGAHVIKVGLSPLIIDLMERGIISLVALNGAGIIHDFELAYAGFTSEDVDTVLDGGAFGMARETSQFLNEAVREGAGNGQGIGRAVGAMIEQKGLPYRQHSILAAGVRLGIPVTVHVALGTDIIHMHPDASGEAIGKGSLIDFHTFASAVAGLSGGVYLNIGSAVILPEVFLKAISLAQNVGATIEDFTTVNMDFIRQYRPQTNVVRRPTAKTGRGITLIGHHEIMVPLVCAGIIDALGTRKNK